MIETTQEFTPPAAVLVAVDCGDYDVSASLDELSELAKSADIRPVSRIIQKRSSPDTATCIGSGRLVELKQLCEADGAQIILFDCELTPTQLRNLEKDTGLRVIDRTMLILDIFAARAHTSEGKLQVELATLRYMLPRLTGRGVEMSRIGGGAGTRTRGAGETQLETDRRHIRRRIDSLRRRLSEVEHRRENLRTHRKKAGTPTVALVGYTNAGKSTLMNALTDAGVLVEDKLFATLDPTARALKLPGGQSVILIDTVGLVRRLPHHLVDAFRSTLEEAALADVILNVCDASSPEAAVHLEVTRDLLDSLGCGETPVIPVLNKCDQVGGLDELPVVGNAVRISALKGQGLDALLFAIEAALPPMRRRVKLLLPFDKAGLAALIRRDGVVEYEEYTPDGLLLVAMADIRIYHEIKDYLTE